MLHQHSFRYATKITDCDMKMFRGSVRTSKTYWFPVWYCVDLFRCPLPFLAGAVSTPRLLLCASSCHLEIARYPGQKTNRLVDRSQDCTSHFKARTSEIVSKSHDLVARDLQWRKWRERWRRRKRRCTVCGEFWSWRGAWGQ